MNKLCFFLLSFMSVLAMSVQAQVYILNVGEEGVTREEYVENDSAALAVPSDSLTVLDSLSLSMPMDDEEMANRQRMLDSIAAEGFKADAAAMSRANMFRIWSGSHRLHIRRHFSPEALANSDTTSGNAINVAGDSVLVDTVEIENAARVDSLVRHLEMIPYDTHLSIGQPTFRMPLLPEGYIPQVSATGNDAQSQALNNVGGMLQEFSLITQVRRMYRKPHYEYTGRDYSTSYRRQLEYGEERMRQTYSFYQEHLGRARVLRSDIDIPVDRTVFSTEAGLLEHRLAVDDVQKIRIETLSKAIAHADVWHRKGNSTLQMSQTALSDNWYKGGDANMSINSDNKLVISRFDEGKKTTFETTLRLQLSGYYTKADTIHPMRVSDNTFRADINYGYKAWKNWYYSTNTYVKTPLFDYYNTNSKVVKSTFLSPLEWNVSVGMDFKQQWNQRKSSFSLLLAPLSYNLTYVHDDRVNETSYGVKDGKCSHSQFGSSITAKLEWRITNDMSLSSRYYYFTDYSSVQTEFENTFNFSVSRHFSARLYVYPRFDDNKDDKLQWKEMFSFGFSTIW